MPALPPPNAVAPALYEKLAERPGNLAFSPLSVSTALLMIHAGAKGETAAELEKLLGVAPGTVVDPATAALRGNWIPDGKSPPDAGDPEVNLADHGWVANDVRLKHAFTHALTSAFGAAFEPLDFAKTDAAAARINAWASAETRGRIPVLLSAGDLEGAALVLTDAFYFKGKWRTPFKPTETRNEPFSPAAGGAPVDVAMMHETLRTGYAEIDGAQVVSLPYAAATLGRAVDLLVLLPPTGTPPGGLGPLLKAAGQLQTRPVRLSLPKVKLDASFELSSVLQALGLATLFDEKRANLKGITDLPIFVSKVFHKAFLEVDEAGTEAAAATAVVARKGHAVHMEPQAVEMKVDHPFLFALRDVTTGIVLFAGRVVDPQK